MSDRRTTLARNGVADVALEGVAPAHRYAPTRTVQASAPVVAIRAAPGADAERVDELLFGESFFVLEEEAGFFFGQAARDGYVGWAERQAFTPELRIPTHRISVPAAIVLSEPQVRAPAFGPLSLNALVTIAGEPERDFLPLAGGGWIGACQASRIETAETDPAAVVERLVGSPYLWGGRSFAGLDCSGLIQQALFACGRACPRDADQQQELGGEIEPAKLARGDLVFWRGHVGMMLDDRRLAHANAHHLAVAIEPLAQARARIAAAGSGEPAAFRRLGRF